MWWGDWSKFGYLVTTKNNPVDTYTSLEKSQLFYIISQCQSQDRDTLHMPNHPAPRVHHAQTVLTARGTMNTKAHSLSSRSPQQDWVKGYPSLHTLQSHIGMMGKWQWSHDSNRGGTKGRGRGRNGLRQYLSCRRPQESQTAVVFW